MAYSPGQPWDKTLSYSYGQTCTYNGQTYSFWRYDGNSTVGIPPNVEEALFMANSPVPGGGSASRMERCWIIAQPDYYAGIFGIKPSQPEIRGVPAATFFFQNYAEYTGIQYHGYWSPRVQDSEASWSFYGQLPGMSAELGLPHYDPVDPSPSYDGNGNLVVSYYQEKMDSNLPATGAGSIPYLIDYLTPDPPPPYPPPPRTYYIDIVFVIPSSNEVNISTYNCFNRTGHYVIKYTTTDYSVSPPVETDHEILGTASTGDVRDNWADVSSYVRSHHVITWGPGQTMAIRYIRLTDITPPFDA